MKILIVRVGRMGDMVMTTPAISALLDKYPEAEFTFLTSRDGKRTLGDFNTRITTFWIYDRAKLFSFFTRQSIKKRIVATRFAHIYCFEHNPSYHRLWKQSDAVIHRSRSEERGLHYCQRLLDAVSGQRHHGSEPTYVTLPIHDAAKRATIQYLREHGITERSFLVAMHPTFSGANKRLRPKKHAKHKLWPPESFADLASRLQKHGEEKQVDIKVVMNLMPEECNHGKKVVQHDYNNAILILCPTPDFQKYKAFLQRVDLLVTADTGPMHIAAAVKTNVIALFSGKDPGDCGPFAAPTQVNIFRAEETKIPEIGIAAISVDDVYEACIKRIKEALIKSGLN